MGNKVAEIKAIIKANGYAFNRFWTINLPSGNYVNNSKLGGWNGMELWCRGDNGKDSRLASVSEGLQESILTELQQLFNN